MKPNLLWGLLWVLSVLSMPVLAAESVDTVKQRLAQSIPELANAKVTTTPIEGVYAVQQGVFVFYTSADANYVLRGDLLDLPHKRNLTEEAQQSYRMDVLSAVHDQDTINFTPQTKVSHRITVFTDVDCPYCHQLHALIPQLLQAGIAVRYVLYPRAGLDSPSYHKAEHAWCQRNQPAVLDAMMRGETPEHLTQCTNPLKQQFSLAQSLALQGTPSILLDNGELIPGLLPINELIQLVKAVPPLASR